MRVTRTVRVAVAVSLLTAILFACQGNACGDLKFSANDNCHSVQNVGSRTITVKWGDWGPFDLSPGQSVTIKNPFGGGCVEYIAGDVTANYK